MIWTLRFLRTVGRVCQDKSAEMPGTTSCPYCKTRFRIPDAQLSHLGMVRCGHCMQTFDARLGFVPDLPSAQLELPILDTGLAPVESPVAPFTSTLPVLQPMTLAEQVAIVADEDTGEFQPGRRLWPWAIATVLMLMLLAAQAAYYFRVELAARVPALKPMLIEYCRLLKCTVPLPQQTGLMGIEWSELEADPGRENQINLNALLRNRAPYAQAYPSLELTLNDSEDKPLARRVFRPADYLPSGEDLNAGLRAGGELSIRLQLDTGDLRPIGYRLALFYPGA